MISGIEAVVLGIVNEQYGYGYEIEKVIKERNIREWTEIAFSSIYYVLKRLEERGLITSSTEAAAGRPTRRVYTITHSGRDALKAKITDALSRKAEAQSPFDLGIGFMGVVPIPDVVDCLGGYIGSIEGSRSRLEERLRRIEDVGWPFYIRALATRHIAMLDAEREWVQGFIAELEDYCASEAGVKEDV